jgi:hypothetical protein
VQHAEEVAQFLRANVVQGQKEGDVYSPCYLVLLRSCQPRLTDVAHQDYGYMTRPNVATTIPSR